MTKDSPMSADRIALTREQIEGWRDRPNDALNRSMNITQFRALCDLALQSLYAITCPHGTVGYCEKCALVDPGELGEDRPSALRDIESEGAGQAEGMLHLPSTPVNVTGQPLAPSDLRDPEAVREAWLESRDFYELMYAYRTAPITDQGDVVEAFENVKDAIRALPLPPLAPEVAEAVKLADQIVNHEPWALVKDVNAVCRALLKVTAVPKLGEPKAD